MVKSLRPSALPASISENLIDRAMRERNHKQVTVWPGLNVGADPEVSADEQALTLGDVEFVIVAGDPIFQPGIIHCDLSPIARQNEPPRSKLTGYQKMHENLFQACHPRMFLSGVQSQLRLDFRRRTDPSEALWRTR